ncbi:MAG: ABC transporter ATP-binding protein [Alphaproteobacteria bacterium]|nr:ABC transporter ATP-binding protein [Alphaproteobacteria bacterium]
MVEAQANLLEVEGARVRFRTLGFLRALIAGAKDPYIDAVLDVSFAVRAGETFGLVGESGSGKTTLVRAVLGLVDLWSGRIRFDGSEIVDRSDAAFKPIRRQISLMFQDPQASLSPRKTVRSSITEPFIIHNMADRDLEAEARELLGMVGLPVGLLDNYPHQLSGGQARRVGVARALALRPKLIIADEPTAGLDVSVQGEVLNLMNELQGRLGLSYVIVTHNLPVIRHVSDRLAIMYLGRFVEEGPTAAIFARPLHPYTLGLLGAVPQPDPDKRREEPGLMGEVPSLNNRPRGCEFHARCLYVQERCRVDAPVLTEVAPGRRAACHFPLAGS